MRLFRTISRSALFAALVIAAGTASSESLPPAAASCAGCHAHGQGDTGAPADLAAFSPDDIVAALAAYRSGARKGTIMPRLAKGFSDAEARSIATAVGRGGPAAR